MTKFKRIAVAIMAAATLTTSAIGSMSASAAADYSDTYITSFTAPPGVSGTYNSLPVDKNGIRAKGSSSSVYLCITSSTYNVSVQTWGLNAKSWSATKKANCTLNSAENSTTAVTVKAGYRYEIYNKIRESKYSYAGLKFASTSQYNPSTVSGRWSPDYSWESGVVVAG